MQELSLFFCNETCLKKLRDKLLGISLDHFGRCFILSRECLADRIKSDTLRKELPDTRSRFREDKEPVDSLGVLTHGDQHMLVRYTAVYNVITYFYHNNDRTFL